ncbi:DUF6344 domain-containing protein [Streptomyces sp. NBC_01408]|uniref:DUF6344 domain-containing protein n=1 Tax=Streptomyces sp. NBC_01408 TaxID=2903855 RepID=UPI00225B0B1D|nr:DUF6344 domain-containing protein [Streptomyces sp. NBC_01408]MCX4692107.1 DUF6344 domain-containing protein [Streptomyces sp. NBC_01408]
MAHRTTFTSVWTAVLAALVALFASLGFGGKTAPAPASVPAPAVPAPAAAGARRTAVTARRTWRAMMRGGSLPPTIKQRIRAEAHGKTPSVRRSTTAAAMGAGSGSADLDLTAAAVGAPAGAAREVLALAA